jgi:hypothetical protein
MTRVVRKLRRVPPENSGVRRKVTGTATDIGNYVQAWSETWR